MDMNIMLKIQLIMMKVQEAIIGLIIMVILMQVPVGRRINGMTGIMLKTVKL